MSLSQQIITIALCVLGTQITRSLPFILVNPNKPTPMILRYLGYVLPTAIFGFLIVMCLKGVSIDTASKWIPELVGVSLTAILQFYKKNMLLSILIGTVVYMILVNLVFI